MALFEQDFLMRQVQHLTQLLQQIIFKKNQNKPKEAVQDIHNAFQRLTKDHPKEFNELTLPETQEIFFQDEKFQDELALAVADLLFQEGEILQEQQFSQSKKSYLQALMLYKTALDNEDAAVPLDIQQKIAELEQKLLDKDLDELRKILQ